MNLTFLKRHKPLSETYLCDVTVECSEVMKCESIDDGVEEGNLKKCAPRNQIVATELTGNILESNHTQIIVCEITTISNYVVSDLLCFRIYFHFVTP